MARRIVFAAVLAAAVFAASASAHEGNADYESLVRGVTPQIAGFSIQVLNGDDRLAVRNAGKSTVTIEGYNAEPYLRLHPDGRVEVNLRSPAHYLNEDRFFGAKVPDSADEKAPPRWSVIERNGRYEFHDHRMHWMAKRLPEQVSDRSQRTKVFDWEVPLRAQGSAGKVSGELFWRGAGPGAPGGAYAGLGAIVLLGIAIATVLVVRRRRAVGGAEPADARGEAW